MRSVAIFGMGAIGTAIVESWIVKPPRAKLACICGRAGRLDAVRRLVGPQTLVTDSADEMLSLRPDIVVEAVGHAGALDIAEPTLRAGAELYLLSVGILADTDVRERLLAACASAGGRIVVPAGALAGFDGLAALARIADTQVKYTSIKPGAAWKGTPAEQMLDLDKLDRATTFFSGSATDAALLYPRNANLAAAVALAGIGFEKTVIELVADPNMEGNSGIVEASNAAATLVLEVSGIAAPGNPKTSAIVSESVISAIDNSANRLCFA